MRKLGLRLLMVAGFALTVAAVVLLASFASAALNPPNITTQWTVRQQTTASEVLIQSGVTFVYTNQYANLSFANGLDVLTNATWNRAVGPGWCFDGRCLNVSKTPASYPSAVLSVSTWQPANTQGMLAYFTASVPAQSAVTFTLYGFTASASLVVLTNSAYYTATTTNSQGKGSFTWFSGTQTGSAFEIDIAPSSGGGGGGGIIPVPVILHPRFLWNTQFALFNATADSIVYFTDTTPERLNGTPYARLWKFGDGNTSTDTNPVHQYDFGLSASFNVSLVDCLGSSCNLTTQTITLVRWSTLEVVLPMLGLGLAAVVMVIKYRRQL